VTAGERLAVELEDANRRLLELIAGLTAEQWRNPAANAPGWDFGEDERRTIGQVALHTANQHLVQLEIVRGVAEGRLPLPGNPSNADEAEANPDPDRPAVIRLLEESCRVAAEGLRELSDAQLARSMTFHGWTMTARQLAEQNQVGHVLWHIASIEAGLRPELAPGRPRPPAAS
jgi:DinB family protein